MADFFKPVGWDGGKPKRKKRRRASGTAAPNDIAVNCPWCHQELRVESKYIGYTVSCPYCEDRFVAEGPSQPAPAPSVKPRKKPVPLPTEAPPPPAPTENLLDDEDLDLLDDGLGDLDDFDDLDDIDDIPVGMKACPFCAEHIKEAAKICKFCKSQLED